MSILINENSENSFHISYYNSISLGLNNSKFYIRKIEVEPKDFFSNILDKLNKLKRNSNRLFIIGNGASSAFANHMALDFTKNGKILTRSLSDSAMLTALSNDYNFEDVFRYFIELEKVSTDDLVISISSSGNSPNIVKALKFCSESSIKTLSLSGLKNDNLSIFLSDYSIYVPMKTYGMVECIHQIFLHMILDELMDIKEWEKKEFQNMNSKNFKI